MKITYVFFSVGLVYGFGLGVLFEQNSIVSVASFSSLLGALVVIPALAWLETRIHQHSVSRWETIRAQGQTRFIATRYVLVRGAILSVAVLLILPSAGIALVAELVGPVLLLLLLVFGKQEWENCEQEYRVLALQSAAERIKTLRERIREGND